MALLQSAKQGIAWNSLGTLIRSVIGLIQLGLVSRYLSAEQLGGYSQFFVCSSFILLISEFGLSAALIHKRHITAEVQKTAVNLALFNGACVAGGLLLLAPIVAQLFDNAELSTLLRWYAPAVLVLSLGNVSAALCQKDLQFKTLVGCEVVAAIVAVLALFITLDAGWGSLSFVFGMSLNHTVRTTLLLYLRPIRLRLSKWDGVITRELYRYGWHFSASNLLSLAITSVDILLISRFLGVEKTGQYGLIKDLVFRISLLLNPVLTRVALPFYARLQEHHGLGSLYCIVKELLCYLFVPIYGFFIVFPAISIETLLGEEWVSLAPLLQVLSAWMIVRAVVSQSGALLSALGQVKLALQWNLLMLLLLPLCIWAGSLFGVMGVAWSLFLSQLILYIPHWFMQIRRTVTMSLLEYLLALIFPLCAGVGCLLLVKILTGNWLFSSQTQLAINILLATPIYMALVYFRIKVLYSRMHRLVV